MKAFEFETPGQVSTAARRLGYEVVEHDGRYDLLPLAGREANQAHSGLTGEAYRELVRLEALDAVLMGFVI